MDGPGPKKTGALSPTDTEIQQAVDALAAGELVVFPTETVYGIGCDALNPDALVRLCAAKQRPPDKGIGVILGSPAMLSQVAASVSPAAERLGGAFWPGPLNLLVPAQDRLPTPVVHEGRIACRVSSDPIARRLAQALGRPIAAPSANPAELEPATDKSAACAYFGTSVAVYLDGGAREASPSTLVDPGPPLRILRAGPIEIDAIEAVLA